MQRIRAASRAPVLARRRDLSVNGAALKAAVRCDRIVAGRDLRIRVVPPLGGPGCGGRPDLCSSGAAGAPSADALRRGE
jgi:hypothetical protein